MGDNNIDILPVQMDDIERLDAATEEAFSKLLEAARRLGFEIPQRDPEGLMYLPDQKLTRDFQAACREIVAALKRK